MDSGDVAQILGAVSTTQPCESHQLPDFKPTSPLCMPPSSHIGLSEACENNTNLKASPKFCGNGATTPPTDHLASCAIQSEQKSSSPIRVSSPQDLLAKSWMLSNNLPNGPSCSIIYSSATAATNCLDTIAPDHKNAATSSVPTPHSTSPTTPSLTRKISSLPASDITKPISDVAFCDSGSAEDTTSISMMNLLVKSNTDATADSSIGTVNSSTNQSCSSTVSSITVLSSITKSDSSSKTVTQAAYAYLPASVTTAPLPKSFPFTLMPISPNGDFPAVQLTLPDLPAVILQVLPLPGAKMGEQYTINVPTPLILSGINSALASGGSSNGGPIMLSIAPSGALPQLQNPATSSPPSLIGETSNSNSDNHSTCNLSASTVAASSLPVSTISLTNSTLSQFGIPTTNSNVTKRMRAIAPKPCHNSPLTLLNGLPTPAVKGASYGRNSKKQISNPVSIAAPFSCTPQLISTNSPKNRLNVLSGPITKSGRGRRKNATNAAINNASHASCSLAPVLLSTNNACPSSNPPLTVFTDAFLASSSSMPSIPQHASFASQPLLVPNATPPVMSASALQPNHLPSGFLVGSTFPSGSNPTGGTPYLLPGPFSFANGCQPFSGPIYSSSTCSATAGVTSLPTTSAGTLFSTGPSSGLATVDPTTGVVTHYPQCVPMAAADGSSTTDQTPFIVYSQPNPNTLGFLLPNASQPTPLVYPLPGQSLLSSQGPATSSTGLPSMDPSSSGSFASGNSAPSLTSSSPLGSLVPPTYLISSGAAENASVPNYHTPQMASLCPSLIQPGMDEVQNLADSSDGTTLAKDDLISIAWRLTQMDDVLGDEHATTEIDKQTTEAELFGSLFQTCNSAKQQNYGFTTTEINESTEVVLLDTQEEMTESVTPVSTQLKATESTGNADIDALLAVAAMVGAASGVGDAKSAVTVPIPSSLSKVTVSDMHSSSRTTSPATGSWTVTSSATDTPIVTPYQSSAISTATTNTATMVTANTEEDPLSSRDPTELLPNTLFDDLAKSACQESLLAKAPDRPPGANSSDEPTSLVAVLGCNADDVADLESVLGPDPHNLNGSDGVTESFLNSLVGHAELDLGDPDEDTGLFDTDFGVCSENSPMPSASDALAEVEIAVSRSLSSDTLTLDYETFAENAPRVDSILDGDDTPVPSSHQVRSLFQNTIPYRFGPSNMSLTSEENSVFTKLFEAGPSKLRENRPFRFPPDVPDFLNVDLPDTAGEYTTAEQFNEALMLLGPPPTSPHCLSNVSELSLKGDGDFVSPREQLCPTGDTGSTQLDNEVLPEPSVTEQASLRDVSSTRTKLNVDNYSHQSPPIASSSHPLGTISKRTTPSLCTKKPSSPIYGLAESAYSQSGDTAVNGSIASDSKSKSLVSEDLPLDDFDADETVAMTLHPSEVKGADGAFDDSKHLRPRLGARHSLPDFTVLDDTVASTPASKRHTHHRKFIVGTDEPVSDQLGSPKTPVVLREEFMESSPTAIPNPPDKSSGSPDRMVSLPDKKASVAALSDVTPFSGAENPAIYGVLASSSALLEVAVGSLESDSDVSPVKSIEGLATLDRMLKKCQRRSQKGADHSSSSKSSSGLTSSELTTGSRISDNNGDLLSETSVEPIFSAASSTKATNDESSQGESSLGVNTDRELITTSCHSAEQQRQPLVFAPTFERPHSFGFSTESSVADSTTFQSLQQVDFNGHLPRLNLSFQGKLFPEVSESSPESCPKEPVSTVKQKVVEIADSIILSKQRKGRKRIRGHRTRRKVETAETGDLVQSAVPTEVPVPEAPFSKFAQASDLPSFTTIQLNTHSKSINSVNTEPEDWSRKYGQATVLFEHFMKNNQQIDSRTAQSASTSVGGTSDLTECSSPTPSDLASAPINRLSGTTRSTNDTQSPISNSFTPTSVPITVCCGFSAPAFSALHNSNASFSGVTSLSSTPNNSLSPFNVSAASNTKQSLNVVSPGVPSCSSMLPVLNSSTFSSYGIWPAAEGLSLLSVPSSTAAGMTFGSFAGAAAFRSTSFGALAAKAESSSGSAIPWSIDSPLSFSELAKAANPTCTPATSVSPASALFSKNKESLSESDNLTASEAIPVCTRSSEVFATCVEVNSPACAEQSSGSVEMALDQPTVLPTPSGNRKYGRRGKRLSHKRSHKSKITARTVFSRTNIDQSTAASAGELPLKSPEDGRESTTDQIECTGSVTPSEIEKTTDLPIPDSQTSSPGIGVTLDLPISDSQTASSEMDGTTNLPTSPSRQSMESAVDTVYANGVRYEVVDVSSFSHLETTQDLVTQDPQLNSRVQSPVNTDQPTTAVLSPATASAVQGNEHEEDEQSHSPIHVVTDANPPSPTSCSASPPKAQNPEVTDTTIAPVTSLPPIRLRLNLKSTGCPIRRLKKRSKSRLSAKIQTKEPATLLATSMPTSLNIRLKRSQDESCWDHSLKASNITEQAIAPPIKLSRRAGSQFVITQSCRNDRPSKKKGSKTVSIKVALRNQPTHTGTGVRFPLVHPSRLSSVFSKKIFSTAKQDRRSSYAQLSRPWRTGYSGSPRKRGLSKTYAPSLTHTDAKRLCTSPLQSFVVTRGTGRRRGRPPTRMRFELSGRDCPVDIPRAPALNETSTEQEDTPAIRLVIKLGKKPSSSPVDGTEDVGSLSVSEHSDHAGGTDDEQPGTPPSHPTFNEDVSGSCAIQFSVATEAETFMDPNQVQIQRTVNRAAAIQTASQIVPGRFPPSGDEDDDGGGEALSGHRCSFASTDFSGRLCERYSILPSVDSSQPLCPRVRTPAMQSASSSHFPVESGGDPPKALQHDATDYNTSLNSCLSVTDNMGRLQGRQHFGTIADASPQSRLLKPIQSNSPTMTNKRDFDHRSENVSISSSAPTHHVEGRSSSSTSSITSVPLLPSTDSPVAPPSLGFNSDSQLDTSYRTGYPTVDESGCASRHSIHATQHMDTVHQSLKHQMNTTDARPPSIHSNASFPVNSGPPSNASDAYKSLEAYGTPRSEVPPGSTSSVQQQALALAAAAAYASLDPMMAVNPQAKAYYDQWASSLFNSWATGSASESYRMEPPLIPPGPADSQRMCWNPSSDQLPNRHGSRINDWPWVPPRPAHASSDADSSVARKHSTDQSHIHHGQSNTGGRLQMPPPYPTHHQLEHYYNTQSFPIEEFGRLSSNILMDYGGRGASSTLAQHKSQINGW